MAVLACQETAWRFLFGVGQPEPALRSQTEQEEHNHREHGNLSKAHPIESDGYGYHVAHEQEEQREDDGEREELSLPESGWQPLSVPLQVLDALRLREHRTLEVSVLLAEGGLELLYFLQLGLHFLQLRLHVRGEAGEEPHPTALARGEERQLAPGGSWRYWYDSQHNCQ